MGLRKKRKLSSKASVLLILFLFIWIGGTLCAASSLATNIPILADLRTRLLASYGADLLNDALTSLRLSIFGDDPANSDPSATEVALNNSVPTAKLPAPNLTSTPTTAAIDSPTSNPATTPTPSPTPTESSTYTPTTTSNPAYTPTPTSNPTDAPTPTSNPTDTPTPTYTPVATPTSSQPTGISLEETKSGGSIDSTSVTTSGTLTAVENDLYIAAVSTRPGYYTDGVSGLGLSWTFLKTQCSGRYQTRVGIWIAQGSPAFDDSVTATLTGTPMDALIAVSRYSGVDPTNPIGNVVSANFHGIDGPCVGGTDEDSYSLNLPISSDDAIAFAAVAHRDRDHFPGAGFTELIELRQETGGDGAGLSLMDQNVAPTSVTIAGSISDLTDWAVVAVELLPAP